MKEKHLKVLQTPDEHTSATGEYLSSPFTGLCSVELSAYAPCGRHAQLCSCSQGSVPASSLPSTHHFNDKHKSKAKKSHFHPGSHVYFKKAPLQPQHLAFEQFTLVWATCKSGFSHWHFSILWVSLALEAADQINSCSCHRCLQQPRQLVCACNHDWKLEMQNGGSLSLIPQQAERAPLPGTSAGMTCDPKAHRYECHHYPHFFWRCSVAAQNASVELLKYGSCTSEVFIINLIINLHN